MLPPLLTPITLLDNEEIIFRTRKHWILFFLPALFLAFAIFFANDNSITISIADALSMILQGTSFVGIAPHIPVLFLLIMFLFTAVMQWLTYETSDFVITNKRVIMRQGYFNRYVRDMRLSTITLVSVEQDFLGQLVDYGTIVIQSFGANDYFEKIAKPKEFQVNLQQEIEKSSP